MPKKDRPFPETLEALLGEHDISARELTRRTKKHAGWGSSAHITFLMRGELPPTTRGMEAIAKALQTKPEVFPEYRMRKARESLDPEVVGFKKALAALRRYES